MNVNVLQPRPICDRCRRAHSTCICQWVRPQSTAVEIVILQHPLEVGETKGTGRLLHLSLSGSVLIACETLTDAATAIITNPQRQPFLLYPYTAEVSAAPCDIPASNEPVQRRTGLRLIVLDATWRKSRKMLHLNPLLQSLQRLALHAPPPSRYGIRKSHQPHQLSTLEATCYALLQLGEPPEALQTLLQSFDGFVAQQKSLQEAHQKSHQNACRTPSR